MPSVTIVMLSHFAHCLAKILGNCLPLFTFNKPKMGFWRQNRLMSRSHEMIWVWLCYCLLYMRLFSYYRAIFSGAILIIFFHLPCILQTKVVQLENSILSYFIVLCMFLCITFTRTMKIPRLFSIYRLKKKFRTCNLIWKTRIFYKACFK